jgi:WD40 repeat protein
MSNEFKEFVLSSSCESKRSVRDVALMGDQLIVINDRVEGAVLRLSLPDDAPASLAVHKELPELAPKGTLLFCVRPLTGNSYPTGSFAVGCADRLARIMTVNGSVLNPLFAPGTAGAHEQSVCSVSQHPHNDDVVTGSFDGTAKVWNRGACKLTLKGQHSVMACFLPDGRLVLGSGNNALEIYTPEYRLVKKVVDAHSKPIRKIIPHPLGLATCANDGLVKIWSNEVSTQRVAH